MKLPLSSRRRRLSARRSMNSRARPWSPPARTPIGSRVGRRTQFRARRKRRMAIPGRLGRVHRASDGRPNRGRHRATNISSRLPNHRADGPPRWRPRVVHLLRRPGLAIRGPVPPTINVYNDIRFQAVNNQSEFPFTSCPASQVVATTPARSEKVYCPTDVRFNGASYPASITGELTVTWSHRNRLGTWSYADSGRTATAQPGTEYDILAYGELGTLVHTALGCKRPTVRVFPRL